MCSMAVADGLPDGPEPLGLALVSYPLHPPGRPDRLRTEHFGRLGVPCLFVSGTRDAFGSPAELEEAVSAIPGPVTLRFIDGRDHSLRGVDDVVCATLLEWLAATGIAGA
jgi:predicted alpha/beta-hydrolase family hydrolase